MEIYYCQNKKKLIKQLFDFEYKSEYKTFSYDLSGPTIEYPNEKNCIKINNYKSA